MLALQNSAKCFQVVSNPNALLGVIGVRHGHYITLPDQFWRRPPAPGEPKKEYPLEAAEEARRQGPYRLDRWTDWRMKKDWLRRQMVIRLGRKRMMMDTLYMNDILPVELRDMALQEVCDNMPRDSMPSRLVRRCALTSRPRATVEPWRVSRLMFRHFADYNKLSGVQRAIW